MSLLATLLSACAGKQLTPIATVKHVDLPRFMGDWYVIAAIPTGIETESYNAVESYQLNKDGTIATTFTFNKGGLNGPVKKYEPKVLSSKIQVMRLGGCNLYGQSKQNI